MNQGSSHFPQTAEELKSFLELYINRFTRRALHILGNREDAEDVVQETIIRGYRMRKDLIRIGNPSAYMFRMVSNSCLDHLRRRNSRESANLHAKQLSGMYFSESKEDNMIRDEIHQQVRFLLNRIPEEQAMVIRLRFSDDLTFPEIAEILGIPVTTVKSRFSYGIIKLRSMMKERREADHEM